jgi:hypothetical protein
MTLNDYTLQTVKEQLANATTYQMKEHPMTHATHTPGPWKVSDITTSDDLLIIGKDIQVARIPDANVAMNGCPESRANARLIAAAPDLLEALKVLQVRIFMLDGSENPEYKLATAAIAAAEKGTP